MDHVIRTRGLTKSFGLTPGLAVFGHRRTRAVWTGLERALETQPGEATR